MGSGKILYTATTHIHLLNFHLPYLEWFKSKGYEVHVACKGDHEIPFADKVWNIPFARKPLEKDNITAYKKLKKIIDENHYELIHCHTPMGGVITRLAARGARKKGTKVLYTSHGFHFFKGAPRKNWLTFYNVEKYLSTITDATITINNEDFEIIKTRNFSSDKYKIDGIGLNPGRLKMEKYTDREGLRRELGYKEEDLIVLYIAEFIPRKNHTFIFKAIPEILKKMPKTKFLFAGGKAELGDPLMEFAKEHGFDKQVTMVGYQPEIGKYIAVADIGISSSNAEGLGLGLAEIMSTGLPVILSNIRGHNELVINNENGYLYEKNNTGEFIDALGKLYNSAELRDDIGKKGAEYMKKFLIDSSLQQMIAIYNKYLPQ